MNNESNFQARYERLNTEQKLAVDTIDGPLMVIAGPGSGKTELLALRVANILKQTDADPRSILCLTFTDSAAINMRKRLETLIGPTAYRISINTFHTFGVWLIDRYREHFYGGARLQPADDLTQIELMDEIIKSMEHDNPLRSYHPDKGFVYLKSSIQAISDLKKAGLTPDDFKSILGELEPVYEKVNKILSDVYANRISKKALPVFANANQQLKSLALDYQVSSPAKALVVDIISSYDKSVEVALEENDTKPITAWKNANLTKYNDSWVVKASAKFDRLIALANVYTDYLESMYNAGYFDFDDMILESLLALRTNSDLRADVQEQFQYFLVDEFQDTNEAQLEIIKHLTSGESNNNRPNVMTVGDDDQAIYRFQGAEVGNLVSFKNHYQDVKIITLQKNYRSSSDIVGLSMRTIKQGSQRIEDFLPEVTKEIQAFHEHSGEILRVELPSQAHEFTYIAKTLSKLINDDGIEPSEIAIIGRRHKTLESLVTYMQRFNIPTRYERQMDVLQEAHIQQIIAIARLLQAISEGDDDTANELLAEIIYYPFWNIDELNIWRLSTSAYKKRISWLEAMLESENTKLKELANYFIKLGSRVAYEPVEIILDEIIGSQVSLIPDDPDVDEDIENIEKSEKSFFSGFKEYYFSDEQYKKSKSQYLSFLSNLRVFISAVREYRQGQLIKTKDLIRFVDIHQENEKLVADTSPFINATNAVNVLTAHKAKGMEFKVVFIVSSIQNEWVPKKHGGDFAWPKFLRIGSDADTNDDKLRLFYVAMTRAINTLYFTSYTHTDTGKEVEQLEFLSGLETEPSNEVDVPDVVDVLDARLSTRFQAPPELEENAFLRELLTNYKLSVTHLNNFTDVTRGGPQAFLEQNLLRFPHAKSASGSYGTAIHNTLDDYIRAKKTGNVMDLVGIQEKFAEFLTQERMTRDDQVLYLKKGQDELTIFFPEFKDEVNERDISELNFSNQNVIIENAHLTGKIDWVHFNNNSKNFQVRDFKTGKPVEDWKGSTDYEKIKLHKYRQQLLFYKLLIKNSRDYHNQYDPKVGVIDFISSKDDKIVSLEIDFNNEELNRLKQLVLAVHTKITNLDFPDISKYPQTYKGILEFEEDLLNSK